MSYFANLNFGERMGVNIGRWVTTDLHVHSTYSGGSLTPSELLVVAGSQLLDAIAITDHHQVNGAIEAEQVNAIYPVGPMVIPGQEISLGDHFHLLMIGCKETWDSDNRKQLVEKVKTHHAGGGAVILAHPWTVPKTSWAAGCLLELLNEKMIDGAELFNASILEFPDAQFKLKTVWENLVVPNNLAVTGGSDFHYHRQGRRLGAGRTYLKVNLPGVMGIIEALRNRRTVAGLFNYRPFDLGCFGAGYNVILGNGPWDGEFKGLVANLHNKVSRFVKWNQDKQKTLDRLMVGGFYQYVADLVEG